MYLITQGSEQLLFQTGPFQCCAKHAWYDYDCIILFRSMAARRGISGQLECVTAFKHINHKAYGLLETRDGLVNALRHRLLDVVLIEDR